MLFSFKAISKSDQPAFTLLSKPAYCNNKVELLESIANTGFYLRPEQDEDTPDDVLARITLRDREDNDIGYNELKYWQYNPDQEIPEAAGGGTGDWV